MANLLPQTRVLPVTDDDWEEVEHKSDEEENDVMAAVAAMTQRDAQIQSQLPKAAGQQAGQAVDAAAAEEALGPSWSDLEACHATFLFCIFSFSILSSSSVRRKSEAPSLRGSIFACLTPTPLLSC